MDITDKILNIYMANISLIIGIVLSLKYISRIYAIKNTKYKNNFLFINKYMSKTHKTLGITLVVTGFIHGLFSSFNILSFNMGTICWVLSILLGVNFAIRKKMKKPSEWIKYHRILTVFFLLTLLLHLIEVGKFDFKDIKISQDEIQPHIMYEEEDNNLNEKEDLNEESKDIYKIVKTFDNYKLKDGIYEGVADAFGPNLTVEVEVEDNEVVSINVVSHNEKKERYYKKPIEEIPKDIINKQSLDVDTISGATYTSTGIINAVENALTKAIDK